jgi:DivIVA domain-containing protein
MAISFSRPDPSSPAAVADAAFGTSRRGFDQQEVRDFLRMVAAELARLQERERFLERELRAAQTAPAAAGMPLIDEDTATRLLGEEAARLLVAARESAAAIKGKAEEGAGRLLKEASDEAQRMREEADLEASRRRTDAAADAEAELAMAKQQGREMVEEARAYRERVLAELSRRRELARQQIEQLIHGRDRLLQAFERARLVAVDVVAEMTPMTGPDEFVDLSPTTGPVPIMVPASAIGDASAIDDGVLGAAPEAALVVVVGVDEEPALEEPIEDPVDEATVIAFPATEEIDDDEVTATDVDDLFARLRAGRPAGSDEAGEIDEADTFVDDTVDVDAPVDDDSPFARRDAALVPLIVASARKLKRVLADEQNDVLDRLRRSEPVQQLDDLVPPADQQVDRYADAIAGELTAAVTAGGASDATGPLSEVRETLAGDLVGPLRDRLDRAVAEGDGDHDAITKRARSVYREWKTQHIDEHLDDLFRLAYGRGAAAGTTPGTPVRWLTDPGVTACADCDDNSLAGAVAAGVAFPTGHTSAPSHAGCRCLVTPVDG